MDETAQILLARIQGLLVKRSDLTRADFGRLIRRGDSWLSEFFNNQRTTNNLRLVMKIGKVFGVPVGYLIGESGERQPDADLLTLLASWRLDEKGRAAVSQLALILRQPDVPEAPVLIGASAGPGVAGPRTSPPAGKSHVTKR